MAASDAKPIPQKNTAYRLYFDLRKYDGSLVTSWTGQDSEVSKDGGNFSDCTNEATEIQTSGAGYLDLTSSEMNADVVLIKITVTNTDALTLILVLYPEETGDIRVSVTQMAAGVIAAASFAANALDAVWSTAARTLTSISDSAGVTTLLGRLTSGRANNLDHLDAAISSISVDLSPVLAAIAALPAGIWNYLVSGWGAVTTAGGWLASVLNAIRARTDLISAGSLTVVSPVNAATGSLEVIRGDDYTVSSGRALPAWVSDDWTPYDLSTATAIQFRAQPATGGTVFTKAVTALSDTEVRLELTDTETAAFAVGKNSYLFDIQASLLTGDIVTLVRGTMSVVRDVR